MGILLAVLVTTCGFLVWCAFRNKGRKRHIPGIGSPDQLNGPYLGSRASSDFDRNSSKPSNAGMFGSNAGAKKNQGPTDVQSLMAKMEELENKLQFESQKRM
jgi:hypothetical protein